MTLDIVIPVFNEEDNIQPLYNQLVTLFTSLKTEINILYVDDGSTDDSFERLQALHQKDPRVRVISFSRNFGHQLALTAGMDHSTGEACILMDADMQHPPEIIRDMIDRWREGYEVVYTIRQSTQGAGFFKRVTEVLFYKVFQRLAGETLPSHAADFRLLDQKVVLAFKSIRERGRFLRGLTAWVGYRSIGLPYRASERQFGESKYSLLKMCRLALDGLTSFTPLPLYVALVIGFLLTAIGCLYVPYAAYMRFVTHQAVPGWASLIVVICWIGGVQFLLIGVLGFYVAKIYEEVKQRPLYLIRKSLGL